MSEENMNEERQNEEQQSEIDKENHPNTIEYKRLQAEIEQHKQSIIERMEKLQFTEEEKQEILDIIEYHSMLKEAAKTPFIKIKEDQIFDEIGDKVRQNGVEIANNMIKVVGEKMQEIINRKINK